jgi:hypothetical protein
MKRISQRDYEKLDGLDAWNIGFDGKGPVKMPDGRIIGTEPPSETPEAKVYYNKKGQPRRPNKKSEGVTYEEWSKRLSDLVSHKFGLSMEDFPDWNSMDAYEDDLSVGEGLYAFKEEQNFE